MDKQTSKQGGSYYSWDVSLTLCSLLLLLINLIDVYSITIKTKKGATAPATTEHHLYHDKKNQLQVAEERSQTQQRRHGLILGVSNLSSARTDFENFVQIFPLLTRAIAWDSTVQCQFYI